MTSQSTFVYVVACVLFALCTLPSSTVGCPFAMRSEASNSSESSLLPQNVKVLRKAAVDPPQNLKTWDTSNCRKKCLRRKVWRMVRADNGDEVAHLMRAIFHDHQACALDGSLRFELDRPENHDLRETSNKVVSTAFSCGCSIADTYALAAKLSLQYSGGPRVRMSWGHKDATKANPQGNMPSGHATADNLRKLMYQYNDEAIALLSSAHNLGHAHDTSNNSDDLPFTTNEHRFNNEYFKNLLHLHEHNQPPNGTFQLPSDRALIEDDKFLYIVKAYAQDDDLYFYHFKLVMELMIGDFTECN